MHLSGPSSGSSASWQRRPSFLTSSSILGSPGRLPSQSTAASSSAGITSPRLRSEVLRAGTTTTTGTSGYGSTTTTATPKAERRLQMDLSTAYTPKSASASAFIGVKRQPAYSAYPGKRDVPAVESTPAPSHAAAANTSLSAGGNASFISDTAECARLSASMDSGTPRLGQYSRTAPTAYTPGTGGGVARTAPVGPTPRVVELERKLEEKSEEVAALNKKRIHLEDEVARLQARADTKVLEGRVAGLDAMVREKTKAIDAERQEKVEMRSKCEELNQRLHDKVAQLEQLEHEKGEGSAFLTAKNMEVEKALAEAEELKARLMHQIDTSATLERGKLAIEAERNSMCAELREELSRKTTELYNQAIRIDELQESVESLAARNATLAEKLDRSTGERTSDRHRTDELQAANERLEAELAQRTVLIAGKSDELRREMQRTREAEEHLGDLEARLRQADAQLRDMDAVSAQRSALQSKLEVLESAMQRNEDDFNSEMSRHRVAKERIAELEARLATSDNHIKTIKTLEHDLQAKTDMISQLKSKEERRAVQRDETAQSLDFEVARRKQMEDELQQASAQRDELLAKLSDLEVEMVKKSGFEGKAKGLQEVLQLRSSEIDELNKRNVSLADRAKQLQAENEGLSRLRNELSHSEDQREHLSREFASLRNTLTDLEVAAEKAKAQRRDDERAKADLLDEVRQRDTLLDTQRQELSRRDIAMHQAEQAKAQLEEAAAENKTLTVQTTTRQAEIADLQAANDTLQERIRSLEAEVNDQASSLDEAHMGIGEKEVQLETLRSEYDGLRAEAEWLTEQHRHMEDQRDKGADEMSAKTEQIARLEERERHRTDLLEELRAEKAHAEEALCRAEEELRKGEHELEELRVRIGLLQQHGARSAELEGNIKALEAVLQETNEEKTRDGQRIGDLTSRLLTAEAEIAAKASVQANLTSSQKQLATQVSTIEQLESNIRERNALLKDRAKESATLQAENSDLRGRVDELTTWNAELKEKVDQSKDTHVHRGQLEGRVNGLESVLQDRERELGQAKEQVAALQQRVRHLEGSCNQQEAYDTRIDSLTQTLHTKEEVIEKLEGQDMRRRSLEAEMKAEVEAAAGKLRILEAELEKEVQERCELELRLKDVEQEAESMLQTTVAESNQLKASLKRLTGEKRQLESTMQSESGTARRTGDQLSKLSSENKRLLDQVSQLESDKERRAIENAELTRQADSLRADFASTNQQVSELQAKVLAAEKESKTHRTSAVTKENKLTTELRLCDQQNRNLESINRDLSREVEERDKRLQEKTEQLRREQAEVQELEKRGRELQDHNLSLQRGINDLELRVTEGHRSSQTASVVREELNAGIAAKESEIAQLHKQNAALQTRIQTEAANAKSLDHELSNLSQTVSILENENSDLQRRIQMADTSTQSKLASVRTERDTLHDSAAALRRQLQERAAAEQEKERTYKKTIHTLTQKCTLADETLGKFEEFSGYNGQLRESNTSLRIELDAAKQDLEASRDQVLHLQSQLARMR